MSKQIDKVLLRRLQTTCVGCELRVIKEGDHYRVDCYAGGEWLWSSGARPGRFIATLVEAGVTFNTGVAMYGQ